MAAYDRDVTGFGAAGEVEPVSLVTPLDELLAGEAVDLDDEGAVSAAECRRLVAEARVQTFRALLSYLWHGTFNPWDALKRLLAVTRKIAPHQLRGVSATDVAKILGETRAATSAREIRVVEGYLKNWGALGYQGLGGNKSATTRARCAAAQKGNTNRRGKKAA